MSCSLLGVNSERDSADCGETGEVILCSSNAGEKTTLKDALV